MKKIFIFLLTAVCSVCLFAQSVKIYKGGTLQYELTDADSVVFCETSGGKISQSFVKGQKVTISTAMNNNGGNSLTQAIGTDNGATIDYTWEEGDSVLVKVNSETAVFKLVSGAGTNNATFEGVMPASGNKYDIQYPVVEPNLAEQYYDGNRIPKDKMLFKALNCTLGNSVKLQAQYAILQLNFYTTAEAIGIEVGDSITLGALTSIQLVYEKESEDFYDNLTINPAVTLETSEDKAKPFYIVVHTGVKYKTVTVMAGTTPDKSGANLNGKTFEAGKYINMSARMVYDKKNCLAAGTRITMADGTTKKVEDIVEGDLLRTFDHEVGKISSAKVCLAYKGENQAKSLNLTFASGKKLAIVGTHDLLLENTRKYVRINSGNVASYVGKRFYNTELGTWDTLLSYNTGDKVDYYCIYTAKHLNCIAEGMLTCPDDVDYNLNIYELDANLKADAAQLAADKTQYGLCNIARDFPEFAQYQNQMEDLGCKYVYIAIGKGLIPQSYIEQMKAYWQK